MPTSTLIQMDVDINLIHIFIISWFFIGRGVLLSVLNVEIEDNDMQITVSWINYGQVLKQNDIFYSSNYKWPDVLLCPIFFFKPLKILSYMIKMLFVVCGWIQSSKIIIFLPKN